MPLVTFNGKVSTGTLRRRFARVKNLARRELKNSATNTAAKKIVEQKFKPWVRENSDVLLKSYENLSVKRELKLTDKASLLLVGLSA